MLVGEVVVVERIHALILLLPWESQDLGKKKQMYYNNTKSFIQTRNKSFSLVL